VIIYNATGTLNFAQGEMLMVSIFLSSKMGLIVINGFTAAVLGGDILNPRTQEFLDRVNTRPSPSSRSRSRRSSSWSAACCLPPRR
jgi:hypothetical protein